MQPILPDMRGAVTPPIVASGSGTTTSAAVTTLATYTLPTSYAAVLMIVAAALDNADGDATGYVRLQAVGRHSAKNSGNARLIGSADPTLTAEDQSSMDISLSVSGADFLVGGRGRVGHTDNWVIKIYEYARI